MIRIFESYGRTFEIITRNKNWAMNGTRINFHDNAKVKKAPRGAVSIFKSFLNKLLK